MKMSSTTCGAVVSLTILCVSCRTYWPLSEELQERIEAVADDADLEEVYNTERHLLYVACTRARDHLLLTGVAPASEFLDDLDPPPA